MPVGETATFGEAPVGACRRHPAEVIEIVARQDDTVGHVVDALVVVPAATALDVEQPAGDVGVVNTARILVFELVQAASAAAVAERLPFGVAHFSERFGFPKRPSVFRRAACRCLSHSVVV